MQPSRFRDRAEAGRHLAERLRDYAGREDLIVLALPRGGVPVGYEVAEALGVALDVFIVRKLGVPGHEELAMGAIASGGVIVLDEGVIRSLRIGTREIEQVVARERREIDRREATYRDGRGPPDLRGKTVILVDDGLATGSTMRAAVRAARRYEPKRVIIAAPVAAPETCRDLRADADEIVCAVTPTPLLAIGLWYDDFAQTSDDEVRELLERAARAEAAR
jgi:putative phosphoribosyl transferase